MQKERQPLPVLEELHCQNDHARHPPRRTPRSKGRFDIPFLRNFQSLANLHGQVHSTCIQILQTMAVGRIQQNRCLQSVPDRVEPTAYGEKSEVLERAILSARAGAGSGDNSVLMSSVSSFVSFLLTRKERSSCWENYLA